MIEADITIIGGGIGGYVAAIRAAQLGKKIVLIEKDEIGGTCLNRGCIPTKNLLHSTEILDTVMHAAKYGVKVSGYEVDFTRMMTQKERVIRRLRQGVSRILKSHGIQVIQGTGSLLNPNEVLFSGESDEIIKTQNIILATGSTPQIPPIPGADSPQVVDSTAILKIGEIPQSLAIIGGGAIGLEFATIFSRLGSKVTVIEMMPQLLPQEDSEAVGILRSSLDDSGVLIQTSARVNAISDNGNQATVAYFHNNETKEIKAEKVLIATGRRPQYDQAQLDKTGISLDSNFVKVDEHLETTASGIYAVGDITGGYLLAHKAAEQGEIAAESIAGMVKAFNASFVPRCVYTAPEIASVGLDEAKAFEQGYHVQSGRFPYSANGRANASDDTIGQVKIITDTTNKKILGAIICGHLATELIHTVAVAMKTGGTTEDLADAIFAHPTFSESLKEASLDSLGRALHIFRKEQV